MENKTENTFETAKEKALRLLERRRHTKKELSDKLLRAGFSSEIISDVCTWAIEYGFLDDAEYARAFISDSIRYKNYGKRRIRQALLFKGIDSFIVDDALEGFDFQEEEKLAQLVGKKLGSVYDRKTVERVIRHFAAKGYAFDAIKSAIAAYQEEHPSGKDDEFEQ